MLKPEREANKKKWFDIIIDWQKSRLSPSKYCKQYDLKLKKFYRYRSLYIKSQAPKKVEQLLDVPTSLIPVKVSSNKKNISKPSLIKQLEASVVEIKLPKLTINTNDQANIDFICTLITRLTA